MKRECIECERARHGAWRHYADACAECDVRWIANLDSEERPAVYEQIGLQVTSAGLARIKELVGNEIVRQKLLREGAKA
jgi:hypothetical protein